MRRKTTDPKTGTRILCEPAIEMCMDISQEPVCLEIYKKNAGPQARDTRFARACTVETHMDISQEPILRGNLQHALLSRLNTWGIIITIVLKKIRFILKTSLNTSLPAGKLRFMGSWVPCQNLTYIHLRDADRQTEIHAHQYTSPSQRGKGDLPPVSYSEILRPHP